MNSVHPSNVAGSGAGDGRRRWVVLLSPGGAAPPALLAGLEQRGARVVVVEHPEAVMVELAAGPRHAVVVHESQRVEHLNELLDAIATYYPSVVCWHYDLASSNGSPRLAKTNVAPLEGSRSCAAGSEESQEPTGPASSQVDSSQSVLARRSETRVSMAEAHDDTLISQDELNMLLGDVGPDDNAATNQQPEKPKP